MFPEQFLNPVKIGAGGFGTVWSAVAPGGDIVAVKIPNDARPLTLARFAREVSLQSRLEHPNIMEILDFQIDIPDPWCVMPLAEGNYEGLVADLETSKEVLVEALRQVISGVQYAHENHILHRDLKPTNILISQIANSGCRAMVADFGLSRRFTREEMTLQTGTDLNYASDWFSAPEQFSNFKNAKVTADIFSLGRILQFSIESRTDLQSAYPGLKHCISVATRTDRDERYQSVAQFSAAFEISAAAPNSLLRPIDQVRTSVALAVADTDISEHLIRLMAILELNSNDHRILHGMFAKLPYEVVERLGAAFPGQLRVVLREYVDSLRDNLPVDSAQRALNLFDHILSNVKESSLRAITLQGMVSLAANYDIANFADVALGWLYSESDPAVVAELAIAFEEGSEALIWLRREASADRIPAVLLDRVRRG